MKTWKIWSLTIPVILFMIASAICLWLWNDLRSNWQMERVAGRFVLNHTPIQHLQSHTVFTAAALEDVFRGTDAFHREWYGFYFPQAHVAYSILQSRLIKPTLVESNLRAQKIEPLNLGVGYIPDHVSNTLSPKQHIVYEIRGNFDNHITYVYVDATSGKILWKYVL